MLCPGRFILVESVNLPVYQIFPPTYLPVYLLLTRLTVESTETKLNVMNLQLFYALHNVI